MPKSLHERNQMECNKRSRKKYDDAHYCYQTMKLKMSEKQAIEEYCEQNHIAKNTLFRNAIMAAIGQPIEPQSTEQ